jgi:hypothetical protein
MCRTMGSREVDWTLKYINYITGKICLNVLTLTN